MIIISVNKFCRINTTYTVRASFHSVNTSSVASFSQSYLLQFINRRWKNKNRDDLKKTYFTGKTLKCLVQQFDLFVFFWFVLKAKNFTQDELDFDFWSRH